jgi:hypothetical protein
VELVLPVLQGRRGPPVLLGRRPLWLARPDPQEPPVQQEQHPPSLDRLAQQAAWVQQGLPVLQVRLGVSDRLDPQV